VAEGHKYELKEKKAKIIGGAINNKHNENNEPDSK
jgi:hypothetical protein